MNKKFCMISGLPRSGSTLLCNLLAQNPRFHCTHTSGCLDVLFSTRNNWDKFVEHKSHPNPEVLQNVLKGILEAYYLNIEKPVIFDKCRGWIAHLELIEQILETSPKILVPVRPLPNILASFEKLYRETSKFNQPPGEAENYFLFQTIEGRCQYWLQPNSPVGMALNRISDVLKRGHKNKLHFVEFNDLTIDPLKKTKEIYEFLDEPFFEHDFDNIEQVTQEDDSVHGYVGLHNIKSRIEPVKNDCEEILGKELVERINKQYQ